MIMTPTEKANELINQFMPLVKNIDDDEFPSMALQIQCAKKCALIAVDEILSEWSKGDSIDYSYEQIWWQQVKKEIGKL